jgi:nitroimidazol reductase NimA-like FMN-containing flavoprotein (pyridoxamine 5'-phosphate oxidase superfamily)
VTRLDIALAPEELDAFLDSSRTVRVATVDDRGQPHVVPLWYVWLDGTMFVNTTRGNRLVRELEAHPRAAATVDDGDSYENLRGVVLHGTLDEADGDPRLDPVIQAFSQKYYGGNPPPFTVWRNRFFLKLEPDRIASWDFRKIPEARARRDAERKAGQS